MVHVSDRLCTVLDVLAADPDDDYTVRRLSDKTSIPMGTIDSIIGRGRNYGWINAYMQGGTRLFQINATAEDLPVALGPRSGIYRHDPLPVDFRVRTLTQLIGEEPQAIVEAVCRQLGWTSPYEL